MMYDEKLSTGPVQEIVKKLEQVTDVFTFLAALEISNSEIRSDGEARSIVKIDKLFCLTVQLAFELELITYDDFERDENALHTTRTTIDSWRMMSSITGRTADTPKGPPNPQYRERLIDFIFKVTAEKAATT